MDRPDDELRAAGEDGDVERLLGQLEEPAAPSAAFQADLAEEVRRRLAVRRGEGTLPEGWALCPFDRFCLAEQGLPRVLGANCPCLHAGPLLRRLQERGAPVRARPCGGLRLREGRPGAPDDRHSGAE